MAKPEQIQFNEAHAMFLHIFSSLYLSLYCFEHQQNKDILFSKKKILRRLVQSQIK